MSKQPPPAPIASAIGPCPTIIQISRTPRPWKFIQHLRTTRPPPYGEIIPELKRGDYRRYRCTNKVYLTCTTMIRGWSRGAMVLGKTSSARASYNLDYSRAWAYCACSRCRWGLFGHFYSQLFFLSSFSLSLGDGPI